MGILATVEAEIVFEDFLEFKALRAQKLYHVSIYIRPLCGRKERKIDFSTSADDKIMRRKSYWGVTPLYLCFEGVPN